MSYMPTPAQIECLKALATFDHMVPWEPKASEVASKAGHVRYWATDKLNRLEARGLVRRSGNVPPLRWRITPLGKRWLEDLDK